MTSVTTTFLRGEVAVAYQSRKKALLSWRHHEMAHKPNFDKKSNLKNRQRPSKKHDWFTPLIKIPKEILAMDTVKFKAPPPMSGSVENQNKNKLCERTPKSFQERRILRQGEGPHNIHGATMAAGDAKHSTSARMNFMVVKSLSPYNRIIGRIIVRPGIRKIQAIPLTAYGMLKFLIKEGIVTLHSITIILVECRMITEPQVGPTLNELTTDKGIKEALHPEYPE
ncbi:hypothetical protein Tco_1121252 [Tanacetum coccineum]|uniref:Reverse transcriptase domain-containing protein n=1 Tax=Tanacetum coccineum TaxID=301880 RepID=A0ABQ5IX62_9ASTR